MNGTHLERTRRTRSAEFPPTSALDNHGQINGSASFVGHMHRPANAPPHQIALISVRRLSSCLRPA